MAVYLTIGKIFSPDSRMKSISPNTPPGLELFGALSGINSPESSLCYEYAESRSSTSRDTLRETCLEELVARLPCLEPVLEKAFHPGDDPGEIVSDIVLDEHKAPRIHIFGEASYRYIDSPCTKVTRDTIDAVLQHCTETLCHNRFASDDPIPHRVSVFPTSTGYNATIRLRRDFVTHTLPKRLVDDIDAKKNVLIFGAPGSGKTTCLRTVLAHLDTHRINVVAIDQSDELRSDMIGSRYFSATTQSLADSIHEVIRNHTPSCLVLDEIVTSADAQAVLYARDRGVQVIATVHAASESDVASSPLLMSLNGGRREAAVSDACAKKNGGHKFMVERRTDPVFQTLYDVRKKRVANTCHVVDASLRQDTESSPRLM